MIVIIKICILHYLTTVAIFFCFIYGTFSTERSKRKIRTVLILARKLFHIKKLPLELVNYLAAVLHVKKMLIYDKE